MEYSTGRIDNVVYACVCVCVWVTNRARESTRDGVREGGWREGMSEEGSCPLEGCVQTSLELMALLD